MLTRRRVGHPPHAIPRLGIHWNLRQPLRQRELPDSAPHAQSPLRIEQATPVIQQWPADLHHGFMPMLLRLFRVPELVSRTCASDKAAGIVDQDQLAMITVQVAELQTPLQRIVLAQIDATIG